MSSVKKIGAHVIHKDGLKFIILAIIATVGAYFIHTKLMIFLGMVSIWTIYFFRIPTRYLPKVDQAIVSSADGKVVVIESTLPPAEVPFVDKPVTKISTFLNVFDVHVNAIPVDGKIIDVKYHPGQFFNASMDKASEKNERNSIVIEYGNGRKLAVVQIAGIIARRIRCDVKVGDNVTQGQIFGLIRFGSRVDIYFDEEIKPLVSLGQRMRMGETILSLTV